MCKNSEEDIAKEKSLVFYTVCVENYFESRSEFDKQLITLSTASLGFLLGIKELKEASFALWISSSLLFLFTIVLLIIVFKLNSKYITHVISGEEEGASQKTILLHWMKVLDFVAPIAFVLGLLGAVYLAISGAG